MSDIQQKIKDKITSKKVVIYSKPTCPFCRMAKDIFKQYIGNGLDADDYEVIEINGGQIQEVLGKMTGERTVGNSTLL